MRGQNPVTRPLIDLATGTRAVMRRKGTPPTFVVAGTRRGGSTSLYRMTASHPGVAPCRVKKGSHYFDVNHHRGWRWFLGCFPALSDGRITGEASPYYMFHPLAAMRMAREVPDLRILVALRNPIDRAWSHYNYSLNNGVETLTFEEAVSQEAERLDGEAERLVSDPRYPAPHLRHHSYLARGRYAEQLERLQTWISPERVHVLQTESLAAHPQREMDRVWRFLGLPSYTLTEEIRAKQQKYAPMPPAMRAELTEYFRPFNQRLYSMPGVSFQWSEQQSAQSLDLVGPARPALDTVPLDGTGVT